jgi:hypothetical protein
MGKDWIASPTNKRKRICAKCRQPRTKQGHDSCIANLPGVMMACCGHGQRDGYIMFNDGRIIRGSFTVETTHMVSPGSSIEDMICALHVLEDRGSKSDELVEELAQEVGIGGLETILDHMDRYYAGSATRFAQSFMNAGRAYVLNYHDKPSNLNRRKEPSS